MLHLTNNQLEILPACIGNLIGLLPDYKKKFLNSKITETKKCLEKDNCAAALDAFYNKALQSSLYRLNPDIAYEGLFYLLSKLADHKADCVIYLEEVKARSQNCPTPVADLLAMMYIEKLKQAGRKIPPGFEEKMRLGMFIFKNAHKIGIGVIGEGIEIMQFFLDVVFGATEDDMFPLNKEFMNGLGWCLASHTLYEDFGRQIVVKEQCRQFAKHICETDEGGNLVEKSGQYVIDPAKFYCIVNPEFYKWLKQIYTIK